MFSSIVVGTDGSDSAAAAVQRAAELARLCGASLHLVTAFKPVADMMLSPEAMSSVSAFVDPAGDAATVCDAAAAGIVGLPVTTHAGPGHPADMLIEVAEKVSADLIVVGNRGMRGSRRVLGSVPNSVSHHAPCTVMIVQTT